MIRSFLINKYLSKEFIKIIINTSIIFFSLGFIMNLFEEINFFKDLDVSIYVPIMLTFLFVLQFLGPGAKWTVAFHPAAGSPPFREAHILLASC